MITYTLLTSLLIAEVIFLLAILLFICLHRLFRFIRDKAQEKKKDQFFQYYLDLINNHKPFNQKEHPRIGLRKKTLLQVLEDFNRNIGGEEWEKIKNEAVDTFLLQLARKKATSYFWLSRNLAARIFLLQAHLEDEPLILNLMKDKQFLVRNPASFAAVHIESFKGVEHLFEVLNNEYGFSQFVYRDALIQGSYKVFDHIIEIGSQPKYHISALKVLAARSWGRNIPFLESDLQLYHYPEIRYWALKVLLRNPVLESLPYYEKGARDKLAHIRALSMEGISTFSSDQSPKMLEKALHDKVWEVRLEAAKGLKRLGEIGINILNNQKEGVSLEVAKYVLEFE